MLSSGLCGGHTITSRTCCFSFTLSHGGCMFGVIENKFGANLMHPWWWCMMDKHSCFTAFLPAFNFWTVMYTWNKFRFSFSVPFTAIVQCSSPALPFPHWLHRTPQWIVKQNSCWLNEKFPMTPFSVCDYEEPVTLFTFVTLQFFLFPASAHSSAAPHFCPVNVNVLVFIWRNLSGPPVK